MKAALLNCVPPTRWAACAARLVYAGANAHTGEGCFDGMVCDAAGGAPLSQHADETCISQRVRCWRDGVTWPACDCVISEHPKRWRNPRLVLLMSA